MYLRKAIREPRWQETTFLPCASHDLLWELGKSANLGEHLWTISWYRECDRKASSCFRMARGDGWVEGGRQSQPYSTLFSTTVTHCCSKGPKRHWLTESTDRKSSLSWFRVFLLWILGIVLGIVLNHSMADPMSSSNWPT